MSSISALSVISSDNIDGSTFERTDRLAHHLEAGREAELQRGQVHREQRPVGRAVERVNARSSASACSNAHAPMATIIPVSSATGMKSAGRTTP